MSGELEALGRGGLDRPVEYDRRVLAYFRGEYGSPVAAALQGAEAGSDWAPRMERQLLPLMSAAGGCGGVRPSHVRFGTAFARCVSRAMLRFDAMLDAPLPDLGDPGSVRQRTLLALQDVFGGLAGIAAGPSGAALCTLVAEGMASECEAHLRDIAGRYDAAGLERPREALASTLDDPHSPLCGQYFRMAFQAGLVLGGSPVGPAEEALLVRYGRFRQMCDQVRDVGEDLLLGRLGVPVLMGLRDGADGLRDGVADLWAEVRAGPGPGLRHRADRLVGLVADGGGLAQAASLANAAGESLLRESVALHGASRLGQEFRLFVRWKQAFLARLEAHHWQADPDGDYWAHAAAFRAAVP